MAFWHSKWPSERGEQESLIRGLVDGASRKSLQDSSAQDKRALFDCPYLAVGVWSV
jgi:hypothetical protein